MKTSHFLISVAAVVALAGLSHIFDPGTIPEPASMPQFAEGARLVGGFQYVDAKADKETKADKEVEARQMLPATCTTPARFIVTMKMMQALPLATGPGDDDSVSTLVLFKDGSLGAVRVDLKLNRLCIVAKFLGTEWNTAGLAVLLQAQAPGTDL